MVCFRRDFDEWGYPRGQMTCGMHAPPFMLSGLTSTFIVVWATFRSVFDVECNIPVLDTPILARYIMPDPPVGIQALPEELLSEILSDQVLMPREIFEAQLESKGHWEFSTTESKWLYARRTYPLLVCKQWFRVGKALLYEAVVVGSTKFLLQIIDIISKSDVGNAVKRLRLEDGAYGEDLNHLVALTPRIHTVFVSLNIYRRSSIGGLVTALPTINPIRILVKDSEDMYSVTREARDVVARCIRQWTSLVSDVAPLLKHNITIFQKRVDLVNPSPPRPWILEARTDLRG